MKLLHLCPFLVPFKIRITIFQKLVHIDKAAKGFDDFFHVSRIRAIIRRNHEFEDGFDNFFFLGEKFKADTEVVFIDQFGNAESGIDGGGLTKEFLTSYATFLLFLEY